MKCMHIYRPQEWVWNAASLTTRLGVKCMHIDCKNGCEKTAHIHFLVDMCFNNLGILINLHSCHLMPLKPVTFSCPKTSQMCNKTVQTGDSLWSLCLLSSSDQGTLFFFYAGAAEASRGGGTAGRDCRPGRLSILQFCHHHVWPQWPCVPLPEPRVPERLLQVRE